MKANTEKKRRFHERKKQSGKHQVRGNMTQQAMQSYQEIADKTG
ncbi:MAG: hypothetical protein ACI8R8_000255, partial [Paraglaciecola sp.]